MLRFARVPLALLFIALSPVFSSPHSVSAQDTALQTGRAVQGALTTGDTLGYSFEAEGEYLVRGMVDQLTVDVVVRILNPDGQQLQSIDGPARGPERFQFETDEEGTYRIEVIPFEEEQGEFSITLELLEPLAEDPEKLADQLLSSYDREDSPGVAVSVFRDGRKIFSQAYGVMVQSKSDFREN